MIKNNKLALILSSVTILMPISVGLILWDKLPDTMVTHWNVAGNADGFASKSFAVFGMPLLILALHWICVFVTDRDKKNKNQNPKLQKIVLCPHCAKLLITLYICFSFFAMVKFKNNNDNSYSCSKSIYSDRLWCASCYIKCIVLLY